MWGGLLTVFYSEDRVRKGAEKLIKNMNAKQQGRLDGFFTVQAKSDEKGKGPKPKVGGKRKVMFSVFLSSLPVVWEIY